MSYLVPTQATTALPTGTTDFTMTLFYGETIIPESFTAELDGIDITSSFNPIPSSDESVTIQLQEGRNVLLLQVDGIRTDDRTASERDRLIFVVG